MSSYIENKIKNCKYHQGDVLVFIGGESPIMEENKHKKHFEIGKSYIVRSTSIIDYEIDELDTNYGKIVIYFDNHDYACFTEFADRFFQNIQEFREGKLNLIIND